MIEILPAKLDDAAKIHEIQMRAFSEEGRLSGTEQIPPLMETAEAIKELIRTQTVLIAKEGDTIIGSARGIRNGESCTIRGVLVEPAHQGRGLGSALLRAIEAQFPDVARFELTTNTLVPGNVGFYERRGYRVDELIPHGERIVVANMSKTVETQAGK